MFTCMCVIVADPFEYISFYGLRNHSELKGKLVNFKYFNYVNNVCVVVSDVIRIARDIRLSVMK
jgi:hypothetical protein